jgi:triosephosphate isomerase
MLFMKKSKHLVVGNWKKNPSTKEEAREIINGTKKYAKLLKKTDVVVCPPFPFLPLAKIDDSKVFLGAQDVFWESAGSFTGEVSAEMLKSVGASYVIVGHSERRALGETDDVVAKKTFASLSAGLKTIVCIGEKQRDNTGVYLEEITKQLSGSLSLLKKKHLSDLIIAYEPIWAVGKSFGEAMSPSDVHETVLFIKKVLSDLFGKDWFNGIKVLYGGAVNYENASAIVGGGETDGLLIGRESVNLEGFKKLLSAVDVVPL